MTPAIKALKKARVEFEVLQFSHDPNDNDFANEAVNKLGLAQQQVFKTLLLSVDGKLHVAISPATKQVDLKAFAKACGGKKAQLAEQSLAEKSSGYVIGGISPFGQKKRLPTWVHASAFEYQKVYVSAGRRGLEVAVSPEIFEQLCDAKRSHF